MRDLANRGRAAPLLAAALALLAAGCDFQGISELKAEMREPAPLPVSVPVAGISLNKASTTLLVGGTEQLGAIFSPANATNRALSWSTSQAAVAAVSEEGLVSGLAEGSATIRARTGDGGYEASCEVAVSAVAVPVSGISLSASSATIAVGGSAALTATISPANATNQNVNWKSSKTSVAAVSPLGVVTGLAKGSSTITATSASGGYIAYCEITVVVPVTGVSLSASSATLAPGATASLAATIAPPNASNQAVAWASDDESVATVSPVGLVTAVADGSAAITVTAADGGYQATCSVTVRTALTGIGFSASSLVLVRGATASPVVAFTPANATNKALAWASGDESIATVSPAGLVAGLDWGETSVTAVSEEGGYSATIAVQVEASVSLFAGDRTFSGSVNGVGSAARFNGPRQIATDGAYLYVVEYMNHMIRKIDLATAEVTTLAGSTASGSADGTGAAASFWCPQGIAYAEGYLYVADSGNNMIRRVDAATGAVTSFAGSTTAGSADGSGGSAGFDGPVGIATDGSYLYVADTGNQTIRRITIASKEVSTLAGIVDLPGSADGTGTSAKFSNPRGIVTDGSYAYVADGTYGLIRRINLSSLAVLTIAGSRDSAETFVDGIGAAAGFYSPHQLALSGGFLYVADAGNYAIRRIKLATAEVSTFAGSGVSGSADGLGPAATFAYPQGIAYVSGKFYVTSGSTIRKLE